MLWPSTTQIIRKTFAQSCYSPSREKRRIRNTPLGTSSS
jgi:hypothetical protein